jgi:hypothetical protein
VPGIDDDQLSSDVQSVLKLVKKKLRATEEVKDDSEAGSGTDGESEHEHDCTMKEDPTTQDLRRVTVPC